MRAAGLEFGPALGTESRLGVDRVSTRRAESRNSLPLKCTIRIYTVRGYLVQTIEHDAPIENGQEPWNLVSRDGMDISYGIYVYHIDAPGIGEKIGRFAIIK